MKQITHEFNGSVYTLDFGKMAFSLYFGEITAVDPVVDLMAVATDPKKQIDFIKGLIYGGINCYNRINKKDLITIEQAEEFALSMEEEDAASLINKFAGTLTKSKEPGEVKSQAESPSLGMN